MQSFPARGGPCVRVQRGRAGGVISAFPIASLMTLPFESPSVQPAGVEDERPQPGGAERRRPLVAPAGVAEQRLTRTGAASASVANTTDSGARPKTARRATRSSAARAATSPASTSASLARWISAWTNSSARAEASGGSEPNRGRSPTGRGRAKTYARQTAGVQRSMRDCDKAHGITRSISKNHRAGCGISASPLPPRRLGLGDAMVLSR